YTIFLKNICIFYFRNFKISKFYARASTAVRPEIHFRSAKTLRCLNPIARETSEIDSKACGGRVRVKTALEYKEYFTQIEFKRYSRFSGYEIQNIWQSGGAEVEREVSTVVEYKENSTDTGSAESVAKLHIRGTARSFDEVVDSALKTYRVRQDEEKEGVRPMHRPKSWNKNEREEAKDMEEGELGSELQRRYQREIKRQGFKIKVVEKSGATLKHMLQKLDPCRSPTCNRINCRTEGKGKCDREGVTYET
ncbi:Hypothetical predicted protein, partial [Paramuricea clavata]